MASACPIVIVGGGPAGAFAAERLACTGRRILLLDEKLAWEKPCGGGLTHKALERYSFLAGAHAGYQWTSSCEIISPSGRRVVFPLDHRIAVYSRAALNGLLLERARRAGAEVRRERVAAIDGAPGNWRVRTPQSEIKCEYVILACGARNPFRAQFATLLGGADFMATAGYYVPITGDRLQIRFICGLEGYIWIFPRTDHASAGICGKLGTRSTAELRRMLEFFLREEGIEYAHSRFYSHVLPSLAPESLRRARFAGDGWAMVGDAAGFVDPITGEGLYFAMRSAELLADALIADRPQAYAEAVRRDFLNDLVLAATVAERFYCGTFLGAPVIERMTQFLTRSRHFQRLILDMFAGAQTYRGARMRFYRTMLPMLVDFLRPSRVAAAGGIQQ